MNTSLYDDSCKELADLAQQAAHLEGLDDTTRSELEKIRTEILANHYKIVLLGSFQGGKSTIFNTACGGRQLSPTGFGLRTSACAAEAHYLEDGEEYARILWRSDEEVLLGFIEALLPHLADIDPARFQGKSPTTAASELHLTNARDRALLEQAHHISALEYKKDKHAFTSDHADLLKIAALTLRHYEAVNSIRQQLEPQGSKLPVEKASRWIQFPGNWFENSIESFGTEEVMFLFIRCVQFHVRSPELQQLRAVLVDCPGLQASAWDTHVATQCISESDAVVWLQGTDGRELSQSELDVARRFGEFGITHEGVFIGFNAKNASETGSKRILDVNLAKLATQADFRIPRERVVIFNALLALRAKQLALLDAGELPKESIESLSALARLTIDESKLPAGGTDPQRNARMLIRSELRSTAWTFLNEEIEEFNAETMGKLSAGSHWKKAIDQATEFIIRHRGRSRLIDRGSLRVQRALEQFRQNLVVREESADKSVEQHRREKEEADQALRDFQNHADGVKFRLVRELSIPSGKDLNVSEYNSEGLFKSLRSELRSRLHDHRDQLKKTLEEAIDSAQHERDVIPLIRKRVSEYMQARVTGWQVDLKAGESNAARSLYVDLLEKVNQEMQDLLKEALGRGGTLLKGLNLELADLNFRVIDDYQAVPMRRHLIKDLDQIFDWADKHVPGFNVLRDGMTALYNFFRGEPFNRREWKNRLDGYLDAVFGGSLNEFLSKHVTDYLNAYKNAAIAEIDTSTARFRRDYEDRVEQRDRDLRVGIQRQQEIARECQALRTNTIEPFQLRLEDFTTRVSGALATN